MVPRNLPFLSNTWMPARRIAKCFPVVYFPSLSSHRRRVSHHTPAARSCYSRSPERAISKTPLFFSAVTARLRSCLAYTNSPAPQPKHHSNLMGCRIRRKPQRLTSNGPIESPRRPRPDLAPDHFHAGRLR
jgi:hypothetical protein